MGFMSLLRLIWPLSRKKKKDLDRLKAFLGTEEFKKIKKYLKLGYIGIASSSLKVSDHLIKDQTFPTINSAVENKKIISFSETLNDIVKQKVRESKYEEFSKIADDKIREYLAPHIVGLDEIKEAGILQLFTTDRIHILLLGDPGTGKTDILQAIDEIAPISSYGLGSGTSSAGLTVTFKGDKMIYGLLPMADNGICCVDELNLMKVRDRGSLLNAMEKGFITYDKANKHVKIDARISLLATANPKGDKFVGRTRETWLKQIPFDPALLSRFHLVFFTRKHGEKEFIDITKKMLQERKKNLELGDSLFIRDYIEFSHMVDVSFPEKMKKHIVDFAAKLKKDEKNFLIEVSPRLILGIIRLVKASARIELRNKVEQKDLDRIFELYKKSLYVR